MPDDGLGLRLGAGRCAVNQGSDVARRVVAGQTVVCRRPRLTCRPSSSQNRAPCKPARRGRDDQVPELWTRQRRQLQFLPRLRLRPQGVPRSFPRRNSRTTAAARAGDDDADGPGLQRRPAVFPHPRCVAVAAAAVAGAPRSARRQPADSFDAAADVFDAAVAAVVIVVSSPVSTVADHLSAADGVVVATAVFAVIAAVGAHARTVRRTRAQHRVIGGVVDAGPRAQRAAGAGHDSAAA